jgi:hypothetical protein
MFFSYWFERRSKWMVLLFAVGSALTAAYSGFEEVYPITVIEGLWSAVALQRFYQRHLDEGQAASSIPEIS